MKKIKQFGLVILGLIFGINITNATEYTYTNLDINADILADGTVNVKETYTANFFIKKHGIIREIPLNYSVNEQKFHIDINNIKVEGKKYTTRRTRGEWIIKIGDPNVEVYGKVVYPISYSTYGLIKNFSGMGYSELYWNIVGYGFDTNIQKVSATINLPKLYKGFKNSDFLITTDGKTKTVEEFQGTVDWSQGDKIIITYDKNLPAKHGITLAIKFPNNYFEFDHEKQAKLIGNAKIGISGIFLGLFQTIKDKFSNARNDSESLIIFVIFGLIPIAIIVNKIKEKIGGKINLNTYKLKGKLAKKYHTVIQYTPPKGLNSAEVGLLLHRNSNIKDLFSLIYKRAAEGLIKIDADINKSVLGIKVINHITIKKEKDIPDKYPEFEKKFFKLLIGKSETNLLGYHTQHITDIENLEKHGIDQGWLTRKDNISVIIFVIISIIILFAYPIFGIAIVVTLCIVFRGRLNKNLKETEKGAELIAHILGYRKFLAKCDEQQLRTFLAQDPLYFDKTLPYAVVFGLQTDFLKKITPIMKEYHIQPNWFVGDIDNIGNVCSITNYAGSTASYSESGGFSSGSSFGGGFSSGGGGGGGGGHSR